MHEAEADPKNTRFTPYFYLIFGMKRVCYLEISRHGVYIYPTFMTKTICQ